MGICVVVPVRHERDRHLFGIKELSKQGIDCVYLLYDDVHEKCRNVAKRNVDYIRERVSSFYRTEIVGCDSTSIADVTRALTYVMKRELGSEIYIDITDFAKEAYIVFSAFAVLFGARLYYVVPKERKTVDEVVREVFYEVEEDLEVLKRLEDVKKAQDEVSLKEKLKEFFEVLQLKCIEKIVEKQASQEAYEVKLLPPRSKGLIEWAKEGRERGYEEILEVLVDKGSVKTIAQLVEELLKKKGLDNVSEKEEKKEEAKVGYRLRQLEEWGFVRISKEREKKIALTEFGIGFVMGLRKARQSDRSEVLK